MTTKVEIEKLVKNAKGVYKSTSSCALTQIMPFQEFFDQIDDELVKAASGLSGGMFSKGSTCGIVFSGAITLAMLMDAEISEWKSENEIKLHAMIKDFVEWFNEQYGTTLCREITGEDLWTLSGVLKCMKPKNSKKELEYVAGTVKYIYSLKDKNPAIQSNPKHDFPNKFHCAKKVLEKIRSETGVGNDKLERISIALDGGLGLTGGACGAMAGSVMAISLHLSKNTRETSIFANAKAFLGSPKKLRQQKTFDNFFSAGGKLMSSFLEESDRLECKAIINRGFNSWNDFQEYGASESCQNCHKLIDFAANIAIELIKKSK